MNIALMYLFGTEVKTAYQISTSRHNMESFWYEIYSLTLVKAANLLGTHLSTGRNKKKQEKQSNVMA